MTDWPKFITRDLGDSDADMAEMERRWEAYERQMKALIAKGGVHQDEDGWWVDDATGELIGPDPAIERQLTDEEMARAVPFAEAHPALAEKIRRGRPPLANTKKSVSIRLDADLVDALRASGKGWQSRANEMLRKAVGL